MTFDLTSYSMLIQSNLNEMNATTYTECIINKLLPHKMKQLKECICIKNEKSLKYTNYIINKVLYIMLI